MVRSWVVCRWIFLLYSAVLLYHCTHMVSDGVILALLLLQLQHHRMISYLIQSTCHANLLLTSFQLECTLQALVVLYYSLRAVALRTEGYLHLVLLRAYCCCCCELRAAGLLVRSLVQIKAQGRLMSTTYIVVPLLLFPWSSMCQEI